MNLFVADNSLLIDSKQKMKMLVGHHNELPIEVGAGTPYCECERQIQFGCCTSLGLLSFFRID